MKRKAWLAAVVCGLMSITLAACGGTESAGTGSSKQNKPSDSAKTEQTEKEQPQKTEQGSESVGVANTFVECKSLEEAAQQAGFGLRAPEDAAGYKRKVIRANLSLAMIEVIYDQNGQELRFRKAKGTEDISGNYNTFAESQTLEVDGLSAVFKGKDGKVMLATWTHDGYAYSLDVPAGLEQSQMTDLIKSFND